MVLMMLNNVKHFIKLHQVAIFRPTFPPFVGEAPLFGPGKQPWVGAPVNSCMNLAMRTFEADNSLEAEESVIKASTGVIWFDMDIIRIQYGNVWNIMGHGIYYDINDILN